MYYVFIQDNKINGCGECRQLTEGVQNIEITEEIFNNIEKYLWNGESVILNPNWEEEQRQKERDRIGELSMTRGDMFEALILAKGVTKLQLRAVIENKEGITDLERSLYLNRFDEALNFYRKYPLIDLIGSEFGITPKQLDKFFETKDYKELLTEEVSVD